MADGKERIHSSVGGVQNSAGKGQGNTKLIGWNGKVQNRKFFPLPNEIFLLGLSHGELAVYCYLKFLENRRTHQCWPSYRNIGNAVGMSENTVRKYVQALEERGLISTEPTRILTQDGRTRNGHRMYTVLPFKNVIDAHYQRQLDELDALTLQKSAEAALMSGVIQA